MKFRHQKLESELIWSAGRRVNELVVESPLFLREVMRDFSLQTFENGLSLTEKGKLLIFSKDINSIFNPIRLDFNNKKAISTLLKILVKASVSEDFYMKTNDFKSRMLRYLNEVIDSEKFEFEIETNDFAFDDLAKAVDLHIVGDEDDYVELLTDYMSMMAELAGVKLFVFFGLRNILTDDEFLHLLENIWNHQLNIFLIESQAREPLPESGRIIVDQDLCEI